MSKPENPPAFPNDGRGARWPDQTGMTLRDWFAGQALMGLCANRVQSPRFAAGDAYQFADAMLAAREQKA